MEVVECHLERIRILEGEATEIICTVREAGLMSTIPLNEILNMILQRCKTEGV